MCTLISAIYFSLLSSFLPLTNIHFQFVCFLVQFWPTFTFASLCPSLQLISGLVGTTFAVTINFLATKVTTSLHHGTGYVHPNQHSPDGIVEVTSFLSIFSALLEKHLQRDELERQFQERTPGGSSNIFLFLIYIQVKCYKVNLVLHWTYLFYWRNLFILT